MNSDCILFYTDFDVRLLGRERYVYIIINSQNNIKRNICSVLFNLTPHAKFIGIARMPKPGIL